MDPANVSPNFKFVTLPLPGIIAIEVFGGCEPQFWGTGGYLGVRMVPLKER